MIRLLMALSLVFTASTVSAQDEVAVTVDIGMDAAMRGEQANLSVVIAATGAPKIGSVHFEVVLPTKMVSFVKLSKGAAAISSEAVTKTEVVKSPGGPDESILRVEVSASKPIPQGVLVSLTYTVAKKTPGPGDRKIPLKAGKVAVRSLEGGELPASAIDGTISVLSANSSVFACFFYMH